MRHGLKMQCTIRRSHTKTVSLSFVFTAHRKRLKKELAPGDDLFLDLDHRPDAEVVDLRPIAADDIALKSPEFIVSPSALS